MAESANTQRKILLLGSGLMAEAVVSYLNRRQENYITVASNILQEAQKIAAKFKRVEAAYVDVTKEAELQPLISKSEIVISYVPYTFHPQIAKVCLKEGKNLVTASYISPAMREFDKASREKGLLFLNEMGVDPGIDHMATMKVIDECAQKGEKIIGYESWCGGLPSPEFCDNPLGYKFSWSPIGAFLALRNDAKFLQGGKVREVIGEELLYHAKPVDVNMALALEGYPNRDSIQYKALYNLNDCQDLMRGTLRFAGFPLLINSFKSMGLMDHYNKVATNETWPALLTRIVKEDKADERVWEGALREASVSPQSPLWPVLARILSRTFSHPFYKRLPEDRKRAFAVRVVQAYREFAFFDESLRVAGDKTYMENLVALLDRKLALRPGEADMLVMQHRFRVQRRDASQYTIKSTLVRIGEKNGYSAMSVLVGLPTAISAQLILDGKIQDVGVQMPNKKNIYLPVLQELEKEGIRCVESAEEGQVAAPSPKL